MESGCVSMVWSSCSFHEGGDFHGWEAYVGSNGNHDIINEMTQKGFQRELDRPNEPWRYSESNICLSAPKGNQLSPALTETFFVCSGDVDGTGDYDSVDDIQIDCGCSAGLDAEEYYACEQYVSMI